MRVDKGSPKLRVDKDWGLIRPFEGWLKKVEESMLETGAYNFGGELQFYPKNWKINYKYNGCRFHFSLKLLEHTILKLKMEHTFGWSIHLAVGAYISKVGWHYDTVCGSID